MERAISEDDAVPAYIEELERLDARVRSSALRPICAIAMGAAARAVASLEGVRSEPVELEGRARSLAFVLASALGLMLVSEHAEWLLARDGDGRGLAVASRLALGLGELAVLESPTYYSRAVAFPGTRP